MDLVPEEFTFDQSIEAHYKESDNQMNKDIKRHLISAGTTFISTFLLTIAMVVKDPSFTFTQEAIFALAFSAILAGVRGVAKLIIEWNMA